MVTPVSRIVRSIGPVVAWVVRTLTVPPGPPVLGMNEPRCV